MLGLGNQPVSMNHERQSHHEHWGFVNDYNLCFVGRNFESEDGQSQKSPFKKLAGMLEL